MRGKAEVVGVRRRKAAVAVVGPDETNEPPLRPSQCRGYMRDTLAKEFRGIVAGFVKGAKSGSCQHVKMATELLAPKPRAKKKTGRAVLSKWLEEMERGER